MSRITVVRLDRDALDLPLAAAGGRVRALLWPGMGARERSLCHFDLPQGFASAEFRHPYEAVYYVVRGEGQVVDVDSGTAHQVRAGQMIYLTPNQGYRLGGPAVFVGGPCPPDPALFSEVP